MNAETLEGAERRCVTGLKQLDEDIEVAREFQQEGEAIWKKDIGEYWKIRKSKEIDERIKHYLFNDSEIYAALKAYSQLEEREKLRDFADSINSRLPRIFEKFGTRGRSPASIYSFSDVGLRLTEVLIDIYLATDYPNGLERLRKGIDLFGRSPRFLEHITYGKTKEDLQKEVKGDLPDIELVFQVLQDDFFHLRRFTPVKSRKYPDYSNLDRLIQGFWRDDGKDKLIEIGDQVSDLIVDEAKIPSPYILTMGLFEPGKEYDGTHELELMKVIPRAIRAYIYSGKTRRIQDLTERLDGIEETKILRSHGQVLFSSLDYFKKGAEIV